MRLNDPVTTTQPPADVDQIRRSLRARCDELTDEYDRTVAQNQVLRFVEVADTAGDDQADSGTKTAERDAAQSVRSSTGGRSSNTRWPGSTRAATAAARAAAVPSRSSAWRSFPLPPRAFPASSPESGGPRDAHRNAEG
jgi:hypothetical protein